MSKDKELLEEENLPNDKVSESEKEVKDAENKPKEKTPEELIAEERDRFLRLYAEFENYKKRTLREKIDASKYANQDLMADLLTVLDDFDRALKEMAKRGNEDDLIGVELIYQKLNTVLKGKGLSQIDVKAGDAFDVNHQEAITQIPAPSEDLKGKIVDVIQAGYMLHDKVIRFARVVVGA